MRKTVIYILFFILSLSVAVAQTDSIAEKYIQEVLVTENIRPSIVQSGVLTQVIDSKEIERIGLQSMADAVRRFAGVNVKDYGGIGGLKTVSLRGLGSQHTAVSYDGILVSNAQSGQVDIGRFSLDNVSILSLTIGQEDNIFQPARQLAAAGVLNIQTQKPTFQHHNYEGRFALKTGSFGFFSPYAYFAKELNSTWSATINTEWQRADGSYKFEFDNGQEKETRKRYNSDINIFRTEINTYADFDKNGYLKWKASYFESERGLPAKVVTNNTYAGERLWDKEFFTQGNYKNELNDKISIIGLGKFTRHYNKYNNETNNVSGILTDEYTNYEYYFSGVLQYKPISPLTFSVSQDYAHNYLKMYFPRDISEIENPIQSYSIRNKVHRNSLFTAISGNFKNKNINATASLVNNFSEDRIENKSTTTIQKHLSPSASFSYNLFDTGFRIRSSYKDTYRIPTFNELYYFRIGAKNLKPEIARQYNVGIVWNKSFNSIFPYLRISADAYRNKVKDKLVLYSEGAFWSMINIDHAIIKGVDVCLSSEIKANNEVNILLSGNYSYQDAKESDTNGKVPYIPAHSGNGAITFENKWLNVTYSIVASGKRYSHQLGGNRYELESYIDHSISVNRTFFINKQSLRFQGELINITNKNYEIIKSYPMPGRAFRILVSWTY